MLECGDFTVATESLIPVNAAYLAATATSIVNCFRGEISLTMR
jgi:hypothetical protein